MADLTNQTRLARIAGGILRNAQRTPGMSRTSMSSQLRPYGADWTEVLEDLIKRGYVIEEPKIAPRRKNRRAVITYKLGPAAEGHDFEMMEPGQVAKIVFDPAVA